MLVDSRVDERTLREVYLPQFEAAVKEAHVGSVMCSYNKLNGQYACENNHLLQDILEREWGFKGFVIADYGAAHDTAASLNNGLDFEPWPGLAFSPLAVKGVLAGGAGHAAAGRRARAPDPAHAVRVRLLRSRRLPRRRRSDRQARPRGGRAADRGVGDHAAAQRARRAAARGIEAALDSR